MKNRPTITQSSPEKGIVVLTLDEPDKGANILSQATLAELETQLDELEKRDDLAGLIIRSGKPGMFIAGADLREFAASLDVAKEKTIEMCNRGRRLFERLSKCPFVTVAAIDGICVGGGAELALWCDRRVMSDNPKCQFGLPEVKLGLFPGWGGTARLPRIAGLSNAVEMITGGESIDGREAMKMGLASDCVSSEQIDAAALRIVRQEAERRDYLQDRERWSKPVDVDETELAFLGATASGYIQQQTKGQYPAPIAALETMLGAASLDVDAACEMEAQGMSELFGSPVNAALLNVFFLTDRNKKDRGVADESIQARPIQSVAVIGAGIMGSGIAAANARRDIPVAVADANPEMLLKGISAAAEEAAYDKKLKGPSAERAAAVAALLNAAHSDEELSRADLTIEAVVENIDVKRSIYAKLEPLLDGDQILATNTSTIPIAELSEGLQRPERFCGIHFFNPVRKMPLVEVIRGPKTSDETVVTAVAHAKRIGKSPIVVKDGPGFLVNRLLLPYMNEAVELLLDGVPIKHIESASRQFGMPMGPITLFDVVGLDTAVYAGSVMHKAFPDRAVSSSLLPAMVKAGRLGQKSGAGFFNYAGNRAGKGSPDPAFDEFVAPYLRGQAKLSPEEITARLFLPMLLEATRVLEEKIVRDARDVDLGLIFGIGFPPFKGGLLFWADTLGAAKLVEMLKPFESLGERMKPTPMLLKMAAEGTKFYD